jgi:hypothetical protein
MEDGGGLVQKEEGGDGGVSMVISSSRSNSGALSLKEQASFDVASAICGGFLGN